MGVKEWRKAAEAYGKKFPTAKKKNFDRIDKSESELINFFLSDDWKVAQTLLKAANRRIRLGHLLVNLSYNNFYYLDAHGLCHYVSDISADRFEATPLDAIHSFYRGVTHDHDDIMEWIRGQLGLIAKQVLKEATQK